MSAGCLPQHSQSCPQDTRGDIIAILLAGKNKAGTALGSRLATAERSFEPKSSTIWPFSKHFSSSPARMIFSPLAQRGHRPSAGTTEHHDLPRWCTQSVFLQGAHCKAGGSPLRSVSPVQDIWMAAAGRGVNCALASP